jgi:hypothetical protein
MSSHGPVKELDPTRLVNVVLEKTKAGKLTWEETAGKNTFIASVGGDTTLEIEQGREWDDPDTLRLLDEDGQLLWVIDAPQPLIGELLQLARRIALRVDEKVDALLDTLQKL